MKNVFVTGTDTDVGKTVSVAALVSLLLNKKNDVLPMKPIQTGCERSNGKWKVPDLELVLNASGLKVSEEKKELLCPYKFELPCSPHLASDKEKKEISLEKIVQSFSKLCHTQDIIIVEGAGGILVPINKKTMMLDLMKTFNLPVILTTRTGLGTINHTLLSINELKRADLNVAGIIFCETKPPAHDYIEKDNQRIIKQLGKIPILGTIPYRNDIDRLLTSPKEFYNFSKLNLMNAYEILKEL